MCGITGAIGFNSNETEWIDSFNDAIKHRGPDGGGTYFKEGVFLGHRRLSIIDLETGQQPLHSENSKYVIVYNGELYNYLEVKQELMQEGVKFKTTSDTEVVLNAYIVWGEKCLEKFRGMFGFAIADHVSRCVFLARDPFGIKPLVYHRGNNGFFFASELSAFKHIPFIKLTINEEALDQYLWYQYIPGPNTIFSNVYKLPPAHFVKVSFEGEVLEKKKYWHFRFRPQNSVSMKDWIAETDSILKSSVKSHLVSDVPFGAFLSGGIDSSLVVSYMSELLNDSVKTFSIGFEDKEFSELEYANVIAKKYNTEHHVEILKPDALSILPDLVRHYGEPFGDSSAIPTYYVSKLASSNVKMVLSGDGGDEGFVGYDSYLHWINSQSYPGVSSLKRLLYPIGRALYPHRYMRRSSYKYWMEIVRYYPFEVRRKLYRSYTELTPAYESQLFSRLFAEAATFDHVQRAQYMDLGSYLPYDILNKVDIASMSHGLEVRTPFVDKEVWEHIARIPSKLHFDTQNSAITGKIILKQLLASKVNHDFAFREKQGFAVPLSTWFDNKEKDVIDRLMDSKYLFDYFNRGPVLQILNEGMSKRIWLLLFLDEWLYQFNKSHE